jgi:hypothetical protein
MGFLGSRMVALASDVCLEPAVSLLNEASVSDDKLSVSDVGK